MGRTQRRLDTGGSRCQSGFACLATTRSGPRFSSMPTASAHAGPPHYRQSSGRTLPLPGRAFLFRLASRAIPSEVLGNEALGRYLQAGSTALTGTLVAALVITSSCRGSSLCPPRELSFADGRAQKATGPLPGFDEHDPTILKE